MMGKPGPGDQALPPTIGVMPVSRKIQLSVFIGLHGHGTSTSQSCFMSLLANLHPPFVVIIDLVPYA